MRLCQEFTEKVSQNARIGIGPFFRVFIQLLLIMGAVRVFAIEERVAYFDYFGILFPTIFLVHAWLPLPFRLPLFVLATIGLGFWIFGLTSGIWFLLIGLGLIGICHLKLPIKARVGIILGVAALLAAIHSQWLNASTKVNVVIPAVGAIFMFRLAIYLYDIRHEKGPVSVWQRLAYFFLLPNPVFTLFPVVDYKTFLKCHYSKEAAAIYQKGLLWFGRGVVHLILYRLVTNYFSPAASEVQSIGTLAVFVVSSYLIYLRMSGLFHLIAGMLALFGFNLPETHRFYLLATGFNDYWQRINIYWKDLMMKLVYYPVFASLKKRGIKNMTTGMIVATMAVFFTTWITHAYQSFWMRMDARMPMFEDMGLFAVDALFWGIFAILVIVSSLFALRRPAAKSVGRKRPGWSWGVAARRAIQIAAMFVLMCLLWSLWQSSSPGDWLEVMSQMKVAPADEIAWIVGAVLLGITLGVAGQFLQHHGVEILPEHPSEARATVSVVVTMGALIAFGVLHQQKPFAGKTGEVADAMRGIDVRQQAQIDLERGYYEGLLSGEDGYAQLLRSNFSNFSVRGKIERPEDFPENDEKWIRTGDIRHKAYEPSATGVTVGKPWHTNQWGQRDREYTKEKPDGVFRIAMLGASYTMGRGVRAADDFESQLETMLNQPGVAAKKVEILNFATTAYSTIENTYVCEYVIPEFQPDAMFLVAHGVEALRCSRKLAKFMTDPEVELSYAYFAELQRKARIDMAVSENENLRRIEPHALDILQWCYQRMGDACRKNGIKPVWVFLPTTKRISRADIDIAEMGALADAAGFVRLVIEDPYAGKQPADIVLNEWDAHPNETSHKDIARQLLKTWRKDQGRLELGLEIK